METANTRNLLNHPELQMQLMQFSMENVAIEIFWLSSDARICYANNCACISLGYTKDELLQLSLHDVDPNYPIDQWSVHWENLKRDKTQSFETHHKRKNGEIFPVEVVANYVCVNGIEYNVGFFRDITERKHSEIALLESEEMYRGLFENAGDLAYCTDLKGNFTAVSGALLKIAGYTRNELLNSSISKILTPDNLALARQKTQEKVETDIGVTRYELEITDKAGKQIPLELVSTLINRNGVPIGVQGLGRDISERKKNEFALQESMRNLEEKELSKSRFLAAAGHDLRQPLAAANLFIDALKFSPHLPSQDQIIQNLELAMANFRSLLDTLLNVSKLDAGTIKPNLVFVSVNEIFNWIDESFTPLINKNQIHFKLHCPTKEALVVCTDIGLVQSVLQNLIGNAIKFTHKGGILVAARRRGDNLLFQVWDTGVGISSENLKLIFGEFYQINNPQRDRTKGLGLGLYIAKRTLALLDGTITCRSKLGRGCVFEFLLPLNAASNNFTRLITDTTTEEATINNTDFMRAKQFVVVEDDILVADALSKTLLGMGADVKLFHSADTALNSAGIENADYYIVDYMLNGKLNGFQFLEGLQTRLSKPLKAVVLTGDTSPAFTRQSLSLDWPVLHKPTNIPQLIAALNKQAK